MSRLHLPPRRRPAAGPRPAVRLRSLPSPCSSLPLRPVDVIAADRHEPPYQLNEYFPSLSTAKACKDLAARCVHENRSNSDAKWKLPIRPLKIAMFAVEQTKPPAPQPGSPHARNPAAGRFPRPPDPAPTCPMTPDPRPSVAAEPRRQPRVETCKPSESEARVADENV